VGPKNPRPALIGNGAPGERPRPHAHTTYGHDKKPIPPAARDRPVGKPPQSGIQVKIVDLHYQAKSRRRPRRMVAKIEWHRGELFPRIGFVVTSSRLPARKAIKVYNGRGDVENRIQEGKNTLRWTRPAASDSRPIRPA
jgi:hypothetical protein